MTRQKKRTKSSQNKGWLLDKKKLDRWFDEAGVKLFKGDHSGAIHTYRRILCYLPLQATMRGDVLHQLGLAHVMLNQVEEAHDVFTQALEIIPDSPVLWYNRGLNDRNLILLVQSVRDLERALSLVKDETIRQKISHALEVSRDLAEMDRASRGPDFTLDQLGRQQALFYEGIKLMVAQQWAEAAEKMRQVIEIADAMPQPQANLAGCLIMQQRYDEAETALKRALEIDPDYGIARTNLELMPQIRQAGIINYPLLANKFSESNLKPSLSFYRE